VNIAYRIMDRAKEFPNKKSVVMGKSFYTFAEFESRSNEIAWRLTEAGVKRGMRTLLFVKPRLDFSVITFALFKIGAIPVLIDPGMGMSNLLKSIQQVRPEVLIGEDIVHLISQFRPGSFRSVKIRVKLGPLLNDIRVPRIFECAQVLPQDMAAILFTSGGTGIPKGVVYTHGILNAQTEALQKLFSLNETHTDVPGFALFALFTLAMGMTSVIPDMDPTKPAQCDPKKIVKNIIENQATFVAGSPAIWERVGKYCVKHNIQLASVKQVVMFGAPVRAEIHSLYKKILPFGDTYTPYGATECLPVSCISGTEVLSGKAQQTLSGNGTCVGLPVAGLKIKIIKTSDIPETSLNELPPGSVGEIVVSGPQVTPEYFEMPNETLKAKIIENDILWHRMGDMGHIDSQGYLWFLGRKSHRVELDTGTLYPIQVEAIFNRHPKVRRSALISWQNSGALVIERHDGQTVEDLDLFRDLMVLGDQTPATKKIQKIFVHPSFPVDVRHNIKIDRLKLAQAASVPKGLRCLNKSSTTP